MDISPASSSINQAYFACIRAFESLLNAALAHTPEQCPLDVKAIHEAFDKYRLWSGNVGAIHSGQHWKKSLDYRLREASFYRVQVLRLLEDLKNSVETALSILDGTGPQHGGYSDSQSEILESSNSANDDSPWEVSSDSEDGLATRKHGQYPPAVSSSPKALTVSDLSPRQAPISAMDLIDFIINCLWKLPIRRPAPLDRMKERATAETSYYLPFDIMHVKNKFPNINERVAMRLGKSISRRRQIMQYRKTHTDSLHGKHLHARRPVIEAMSDPGHGTIEIAPSFVASTQHTHDTKATTLKLDAHEQTLARPSNLYTSSISTLISSVGSEQSDNEIPIKIPNRPKGDNGDALEQFICPYCLTAQSIKTDRRWKKHVLADLQPYVCTYPECSLNDYVFENKEEWFQHEVQSHRYEWFCNVDAHKRFDDASDFLEHMKASHEDGFRADQLPALQHVFQRPTRSQVGACPLCKATSEKLKTHLSRHLKQLALFAIPQTDYMAESDTEDAKSDVAHRSHHDMAESATDHAPSDVAHSSHDDMSTSQPPNQRLKCPFYQRHLQRHTRASCMGPVFRDLSGIKKHIMRVHMQPLRCPRCWTEMKSNAALADHLQAEIPCSKQPEPTDDRHPYNINLDFKKGKYAQAKSQEQKWMILYLELFPDETEIPSPYDQHNSVDFDNSKDKLNQVAEVATFQTSHVEPSQYNEDLYDAFEPLISERIEDAQAISWDFVTPKFQEARAALYGYQTPERSSPVEFEGNIMPMSEEFEGTTIGKTMLGDISRLNNRIGFRPTESANNEPPLQEQEPKIRNLVDFYGDMAVMNPNYQERPHCGASIGAYRGEHLPPGSLGGIILVDGEPYGLTVHHILDAPSDDESDDEGTQGHNPGTDIPADADSNDHSASNPYVQDQQIEHLRHSNPLFVSPDAKSEDKEIINPEKTHSTDVHDNDGSVPNHDLQNKETVTSQESTSAVLDSHMPTTWDLDVSNDTDSSLAFSDHGVDESIPESTIGEADPPDTTGDIPGILPGEGKDIIITQPAIDDVDEDFFPSEEDRDADHLDSHRFGHVYASSGIKRWERDGILHEIDWALIKVDPARLQSYNVVQGGKRFHPESKAEYPPPDAEPVSRRHYTYEENEYPTEVAPADSLGGLNVHCFGRTSGLRGGQIGPSMKRVRIYRRVTFSSSWYMTGGFGVGGDAGAWVIENGTGRVCGIVLAWWEKEQFAYIMPMEIILEDIKRTLRASDVSLPRFKAEQPAPSKSDEQERPAVVPLANSCFLDSASKNIVPKGFIHSPALVPK